MAYSKPDRIQVLVVDDDNDLLRTLADILRLRGYEPYTALTGRDGLELAEGLASPPAIALVDLRLPDMDGIELVGHLRAVSERTEVVILTGNASLDSAVRALREQSFDYLVKPVQPDQLFHTIEKASERWQRKVAEAARRESEEQLRRIFDTVGDALFITDSDGLIVDVNPAACELTDTPSSDLGLRPFAGLFAAEDPDSGTDRAVGAASPRRLTGERSIRTRDGSLRLVDVRTARFAPDRYVHMVRDLTEQRMLEEQLRQAQKMEAVGRLAGGVAHDFNNVLTAIRGYAAFLLDDCERGTALHEDLDEIRKAADRASALTRQLLAFSRRQVLQLRVLDLAAIVRDMQKLLLRVIGADIELRTDLAPDLGHVKADAGHIEQVVMNLVVNARDAMPDGGRITLEARSVEVDRDYARRSGFDVQPGSYVMLAVRDTGGGIDGATLAHVFEPFFTTKEKGKGTGLGLSTVHGIVQQLGGFIAVESRPGHGSTFRVHLPRVDEPVEELPRQETRAAGRSSGSETILVAEDDAAVRALVRKALLRRGYTVLEAGNGDEAVAVAERHPDPIHLMLTDVIMPGMTGRELVARITAARPALKILYTSGYSEDQVAHRGVLDPGIAFLEKPFTPDGLARKVREVLGASVQS